MKLILAFALGLLAWALALQWISRAVVHNFLAIGSGVGIG